MTYQSVLNSPPVLGTWNWWCYPTGTFGVDIMGRPTNVTPPVLVIEDFSVYPSASMAATAQVGQAGLMRAFRAFAGDLKAMGYTHVRLIGTRVSGANPQRAFDYPIVL